MSTELRQVSPDDVEPDVNKDGNQKDTLLWDYGCN